LLITTADTSNAIVIMPSKAQRNPDLSCLAPLHEGTSKGKPERPKKRPRSDDRGIKLVQDAQKKKQKKEEIQSHKLNVCDFNFVYVGNLQSTITTSLLENFFKFCGQIKRTIIRCSRGQAILSGLAVPREVLGPRDRQYASIEFIDPQSARKALECNGMVLDGCQLVVSASPTDLPECQEIVQDKIACMRKKQLGPMPPARNTPQRPVITCPTEQFTDYRDPRKDRHNIFGVSFAKGIMWLNTLSIEVDYIY